MTDELDPNAVESGESPEPAGGIAHDVLDYLARSIVDDPDGVEISSSQWRQRVSLNLSVSPSDMGKVIGRRGRTAQAIRTVVRAAGARDGKDIHVDIVD
jgi:uncharacterized protein